MRTPSIQACINFMYRSAPLGYDPEDNDFDRDQVVAAIKALQALRALDTKERLLRPLALAYIDDLSEALFNLGWEGDPDSLLTDVYLAAAEVAKPRAVW
jgi:hypothetical protein